MKVVLPQFDLTRKNMISQIDYMNITADLDVFRRNLTEIFKDRVSQTMKLEQTNANLLENYKSLLISRIPMTAKRTDKEKIVKQIEATYGIALREGRMAQTYLASVRDNFGNKFNKTFSDLSVNPSLITKTQMLLKMQIATNFNTLITFYAQRQKNITELLGTQSNTMSFEVDPQTLSTTIKSSVDGLVKVVENTLDPAKSKTMDDIMSVANFLPKTMGINYTDNLDKIVSAAGMGTLAYGLYNNKKREKDVKVLKVKMNEHFTQRNLYLTHLDEQISELHGISDKLSSCTRQLNSNKDYVINVLEKRMYRY